MKYSTFFLALLVAPSQAFVSPSLPMKDHALRAEEIDFDGESVQKLLVKLFASLYYIHTILVLCNVSAPTDRAASVGNVVQSPKKVFGLDVPSFLAKAFNMEGPAEHFPVGHIIDEMDDECYLGKDGNSNECVDFDPLP